MTSAEVEVLIYDWMDKHCPGEADLPEAPTCDDIAIVPEVVRIIAALDAIEYNVSTGGWAQFLWNCFERWRQVIDLGRLGYRTMGASVQLAALDALHTVCELNEDDCWGNLAR